MNDDPSLRWLRSWRVPEIGHVCELRLDERLVVPLTQGIAVVDSRQAGVVAEVDHLGLRGAVLEVSSVVSEDVPMNLSARYVASEGIRGDDSFADGVEVGGGAVNAGSGGAGHVDRRQNVHKASSDEGHGSGDHCSKLHFVKLKSVCVE